MAVRGEPPLSARGTGDLGRDGGRRRPGTVRDDARPAPGKGPDPPRARGHGGQGAAEPPEKGHRLAPVSLLGPAGRGLSRSRALSAVVHALPEAPVGGRRPGPLLFEDPRPSSASGAAPPARRRGSPRAGAPLRAVARFADPEDPRKPCPRHPARGGGRGGGPRALGG